MPRRVYDPSHAQTTRVDIGDGDYVVVKKNLTVRDREEINSRVARSSKIQHVKVRDSETGKLVDQVQGINMAVSFSATIERAMVEWGGPGFCTIDHDESGAPEHGSNGTCRSIEITPESISNLDEDTAAIIVEAIGATNPTPREDSENP